MRTESTVRRRSDRPIRLRSKKIRLLLVSKITNTPAQLQLLLAIHVSRRKHLYIHKAIQVILR